MYKNELARAAGVSLKVLNRWLEPITGNPSPITQKVIRDGQILILRGEKTYTITGQEIK